MSQAGIINIGGSPHPAIETVTGDDAVKVPPTGNNINFLGGTTTTNNPHGITSTGNAGTSTETYSLTNRFQGLATTVGATTANVITFPLTLIGTFFLNFSVAAFNTSTPSGAGYVTYTTVRTDGVTATIIGDTDSIVHEDAALIATNAQVIVSVNTVIFQVTGVAGLTIDWSVVGNYIVAT